MIVEQTEGKKNGEIEMNHHEDKPRELEVLKEDMENIKKKSGRGVSYFKLLYTFADKKDIIFICLASLGSLVAGVSMPMISLLLGNAINLIDPNVSAAKIKEDIAGLTIRFIIAGLAIFVGSGMMVSFWTLVGKSLINKLNEEYFRVIMKQDQSWFDQTNTFEFATKVQFQIKTIENGVIIYINNIDWKQTWNSIDVYVTVRRIFFSWIYNFLAIVTCCYCHASIARTRRLVHGESNATRVF
jgi:hypothetical protein